MKLFSKQIDKRIAAYQRELIETHYVEVGNMYCQLNHTLSSVYSVRRGYTISIPITNHNQLCYINSKRIFKGQKEQSAKDYREMIYGFSPGFYRHCSFLPSTMQKKE